MQDFENAEKIFNENVKRNSTTILNLISHDEKLNVTCKIVHEFGLFFGMGVKLPEAKSFGKIYAKEEHEIIGYLSQFKIAS